jgi:hypothetical protein
MVISQTSKRTIFPPKKQVIKSTNQNKDFIIKHRVKKEANEN